MKMKRMLICLVFLLFAISIAAQTPIPQPPQAPDIMTPETTAAISRTAYKVWLESYLDTLWTYVQNLVRQQNTDEQKEAADHTADQAAIASALATALAKDANSLQSCSSGQICSFTLPACDISGVWKADLNNGPTQPSADPTFTCKAGWMQPGERLYYTQYVPLAGLYTVSASIASVPTTACPATQAGSFHIEIAGVRFPLDGSSIPVPRTATWSSYQTLVLGQIQLSGGITKFAFVNDSPAPSCFDLLWVGFAK